MWNFLLLILYAWGEVSNTNVISFMSCLTITTPEGVILHHTPWKLFTTCKTEMNAFIKPYIHCWVSKPHIHCYININISWKVVPVQNFKYTHGKTCVYTPFFRGTQYPFQVLELCYEKLVRIHYVTLTINRKKLRYQPKIFECDIWYQMITECYIFCKLALFIIILCLLYI